MRPAKDVFSNPVVAKGGDAEAVLSHCVAGALQATEEKKTSSHVDRKLKARNKDHKLPRELDDQFASGRLYAAIASRPGQCGRCDGYILEGKELEFYLRKLSRKKSAAKQ